ncbi:MAG TPA: hypothetical protein VI981_00010 [Candidatus Paceibacterota bacterium]
MSTKATDVTLESFLHGTLTIEIAGIGKETCNASELPLFRRASLALGRLGQGLECDPRKVFSVESYDSAAKTIRLKLPPSAPVSPLEVIDLAFLSAKMESEKQHSGRARLRQTVAVAKEPVLCFSRLRYAGGGYCLTCYSRASLKEAETDQGFKFLRFCPDCREYFRT